MKKRYRITTLPDGFSREALAAFAELGDCELFEINGRLVLIKDRNTPDDREDDVYVEFASFAQLEEWLLGGLDKAHC